MSHAIVAPAAALLTDTDGTTSVMVIGSDNKPLKKKVKVGIRSLLLVVSDSGWAQGRRARCHRGSFRARHCYIDDVLAKHCSKIQALKAQDEGDDAK